VAAATDDEKVAAARDAAERVESDRATVALLQNKLDYAVLRAPVAGVITAVLADPGTVVSEGQAVVRLAEADGLEVEVALPEGVAGDALAMQRSGAAAEVTFWARPETRLAAHLRELSPSADTKLRTFTARYVIEAPPDWVALGMTATLHLGGMVGDPVVSLPAAAITDRGDGPMVWVVDPRTGALAGRPVRVSGLRLDRTLVTGLRPGELVVAMGVQKLDPAARVRVADIRPASE
jgi:RND family efflux transporter MFP subunit